MLQRKPVWNTAVFSLPADFNVAVDSLRHHQPVLLLHNRRLRTERCHLHTTADPFLFVHDGELFLFVEEKRSYQKGRIACYSTSDLVRWQYLGEVLAQDHHLSYPYVFEQGGDIFLLPESSAAGCVRLYRASAFPRQWEPGPVLLRGDFADSSIHWYGGRFWLLASRGYDELHAFSSAALDGPWTPHPGNPLVKNAACGRSAGGLIGAADTCYRLSQDCRAGYGRGLSLSRLLRLDEETFQEQLVSEHMFANQFWWNAHGSHHLSTVAFNGRRVLALDGRSMDYRLNRIPGLAFRLARG